MAELEKVIKGLRCLSNPYIQDMDERDCENCKYDNASCFLDVTADALSLLKAQDAGWISADNRPPSQGRYLVYGLTEFVPDHIDQPNAYLEVKIAYWSNRFGWDCKVKYWMPLPEPPKEET